MTDFQAQWPVASETPAGGRPGILVLHAVSVVHVAWIFPVIHPGWPTFMMFVMRTIPMAPVIPFPAKNTTSCGE